MPYDAAAAVVKAAGGLAGKIVVDLTNPMKADFSGLAIGFSTSAAEEISRLAPQANVVKGFNTLFASVLQNGHLVVWPGVHLSCPLSLLYRRLNDDSAMLPALLAAIQIVWSADVDTAP